MTQTVQFDTTYDGALAYFLDPARNIDQYKTNLVVKSDGGIAMKSKKNCCTYLKGVFLSK